MYTVDKGFELRYSKLSHRRKFIRTVWITVIGIILVLLFIIMKNEGLYPFGSVFMQGIIGFGTLLLIAIVGLIQGISEYRKWKAEL